MPSTHAPDDLVIHPRNLRFGTEGKPQRWWLNGDPVATAWHNALSITFPAGETFFIESVRRFQKQVPDDLARQIKDFAKQEAFHTREHNEFNARVEADGYEIASEVARVEDRLREARERHPVGQLAMTVALEHFTAIFAHTALKNPALMADTDRDSQRMWAWHAIEEIEHKSVAFDTYAHVMREAPVAQALEHSLPGLPQCLTQFHHQPLDRDPAPSGPGRDHRLVGTPETAGLSVGQSRRRPPHHPALAGLPAPGLPSVGGG